MKGPLGSTKFFILLALAAEPMRGSTIRDQITGDTLGAYLSDGTLYEALASMKRVGLIEDRGGHKVYNLTEKGRRLLEQESRCLGRAVALSKQRLGRH